MFELFKKIGCVPSRILGCQKCKKIKHKCTREVENINNITYENMLKKIREGSVLIDVRTKQEFSEKHIDGAILIPYFELYNKIQYVVPSKEQPIVVYCQNGGRSLKAYNDLKKLGYSNIYNLKGGIEEI